MSSSETPVGHKRAATKGRAGLLKAVLVGSLATIIVAAHGIGNAADDAGAVDIGFVAPVRSADGYADEALAKASRDDLAGAVASGRKAVRRLPVKQSVLRKLGEAELAASGSEDWSNETILVSGLLGWRDSTAQARLLMARAADGDLEGAIDHLDAVFRRSEISPELFNAIGQGVENDDIRSAMVERIAANPPWRDALFGAVGEFGDERSTRGFAQILIDLSERKDGTVSKSEVDPVLTRLAMLDLDTELVRVADLLDVGTESGELITDPQFFALSEEGKSEDGSSGPFDWKKGRAQRSIVTVGPGEGDAKALKVRSRSRVSGVILYQNLRLSPGEYRLGYTHRKTDSALTWQIRCGRNVLATNRPTEDGKRPSKDWVDASQEFSVSSGCPIQKMELRIGRNLMGEAAEGNFGPLSLTRR